MSAVLLDTTVLIDLLRGRPGARRRLVEGRTRGDILYTSAVNVEEVTRGLHPREEDAALGLFEGLRITPLGMPEGRLAGFWRRTRARRGTTLSQADCLVAAAATSLGARLATGNPKDYSMPGVSVEHWPVGE